jgi:catechol 2,3-dioxygenase-like lactoylglutathione lyase family enzyme
MVAIKSVAHFSIPVSDIGKSTRFYTEVVGCRHLMTVPRGDMVFLDAAGTCLILVRRPPPINPEQDGHGGVHHAFAVPHDQYAAALDHLRAHGVEIVFEEDRQSGVLNGPARNGAPTASPDWGDPPPHRGRLARSHDRRKQECRSAENSVMSD